MNSNVKKISNIIGQKHIEKIKILECCLPGVEMIPRPRGSILGASRASQLPYKGLMHNGTPTVRDPGLMHNGTPTVRDPGLTHNGMPTVRDLGLMYKWDAYG